MEDVIVEFFRENKQYSDEQKKLIIGELHKIYSMQPGSEKELVDRILDDLKFRENAEELNKTMPGLAIEANSIRDNINLRYYGGQSSDNPNSHEIDDETRFDLSSSTKMLTAILIYHLAEEGKIDLDKTLKEQSKLNLDNYASLGLDPKNNINNIDVPIRKLLKFGSKIYTDGSLDEMKTKDDAKRCLLSSHVASYDTFGYADQPYMALLALFGSNLKEASKNYLKEFNDFYVKKLGLTSFSYKPYKVAGGKEPVLLNNGNVIYGEQQVFDPKARKALEAGFVPLHAGVFATNHDKIKLDELISMGRVLKPESLKDLLTTYDENKGLDRTRNKAAGVYVKLPSEENKSSMMKCDVPLTGAKYAYAHEGSTGDYGYNDPVNGISVEIGATRQSTHFARYIRTSSDPDVRIGDTVVNDLLKPNTDYTVIGGETFNARNKPDRFSDLNNSGVIREQYKSVNASMVIKDKEGNKKIVDNPNGELMGLARSHNAIVEDIIGDTPGKPAIIGTLALNKRIRKYLILNSDIEDNESDLQELENAYKIEIRKEEKRRVRSIK